MSNKKANLSETQTISNQYPWIYPIEILDNKGSFTHQKALSNFFDNSSLMPGLPHSLS